MEQKKIKELQDKLFEILQNVAEDYKDQPEYQTLKMNISNVLKEVNAMRIRSIVGELNNQDNEK